MPATTWTTVRTTDALPPKRRFELNEAALSYLDSGPVEGRPLLLVHGFPRNAYLWRGCLGPLSDAGFRAIAPDLLGLGESEGPQAGDFSLRRQALLLDALLEHLGSSDVGLVGEGLGAAVCVALCALRRGRVRALLLADPIEWDAPFGALGVAARLARAGSGELVLGWLTARRAVARLRLRGGATRGPSESAGDLYLRPVLAGPSARGRLLALLASLRSAELATVGDGFRRAPAIPTLICRSGARWRRPVREVAGSETEERTLRLTDRATRLIEEAPLEFLRIALPFLGSGARVSDSGPCSAQEGSR